jgi:hypothetical protein
VKIYREHRRFSHSGRSAMFMVSDAQGSRNGKSAMLIDHNGIMSTEHVSRSRAINMALLTECEILCVCDL